MAKTRPSSIKQLIEHTKRVREQLEKKKRILVDQLNPINEQLKALGELLQKLEVTSAHGSDTGEPTSTQGIEPSSSDASHQTQITLQVADAGSGYAVKLIDEALAEQQPLRFKDIIKRIQAKYGPIPPTTLNTALIRNTEMYEAIGKKGKKMWRKKPQ